MTSVFLEGDADCEIALAEQGDYAHRGKDLRRTLPISCK